MREDGGASPGGFETAASLVPVIVSWPETIMVKRHASGTKPVSRILKTGRRDRRFAMRNPRFSSKVPLCAVPRMVRASPCLTARFYVDHDHEYTHPPERYEDEIVPETACCKKNIFERLRSRMICIVHCQSPLLDPFRLGNR